ncbi:MAG: ABC transporter permease [Planctomycetes bacterium]|nr:ABC transporter permease [Planctomycetota bacterium]
MTPSSAPLAVPTPPVPPAPAPASAAEPPIEGKSYWDVVWRQLRKDKPALVAGAILVLLGLSAILAPLLANDKPYWFTGTMPGLYQNQFLDWKDAAHNEFVETPAALARAQATWDKLGVPLMQLKTRLRVEDWRSAGELLDAKKKEIETKRPNDFKWKNDDVSLAEVKKELGPADWATVEPLVRRAADGLEGEYRLRLTRSLRGIELALTFLAEQLRPGVAGEVPGLLAEYRAVAADGDFVRLRGDAYEAARTRLAQLGDRAAALLDPEKVDLVPATYYPLFRSLTAIDFFSLAFVAGCFTWLPATWRWLSGRRRLPRERRARILLALAFLPPLAAAGLRLLHGPPFESIDYKRAHEEKEIVASAWHMPPIPFGFNEAHQSETSHRPTSTYYLGTDETGRDLLTRMLWGGRVSLSVGFVAVGIYSGIGILLGALAGYFRGWVDMLISRLIEWMMCFPTFFLVLAAVAFLPPNIFNIMLVIGLTGWTTEARLVRGEFLRLSGEDFVLAARAVGVPAWRIIFVHVLPNGLAPLLVAASFGVAGAILTESSLSFLGFGVQIPDSSWGSILSAARENFHAWWLILFPGLAIFVTVTAFNLLGEGLRDATDPRMKV